ncbi:MAG: DUF2461 domain-containing protein [Micromonosporaceae bacterium]|nr:DUF2461 domain-containing protein [Micromonosporaceae bacterium]
MAFRGWPSEALEFFEGLAADNSRTYWMAHKDVYDKQVAAPMSELLAELAETFGPGRVFRPYRDVRFSKDKSPYKTNIAATLESGGYIHLDADGLGAGRGRWQMSPEQLIAYRAAVDEEKSGVQLARIVAALRKRGIEVHSHGELKSAPRGYPKDHPRVDLLRCRGITAWQQWPAAAWLGTAAAKRRVVDFLHAAQPLDDWLGEHLGGPDHE